MADDIQVAVDAAGIAVVTLNRPEKRNVVSLAMWRGLGEIYRGFARRSDVRVVILTGAGGHFCGGADISEFSKVRNTWRTPASTARRDGRRRRRSSTCRSRRSPRCMAMAWVAAAGWRWRAICAWATRRRRWAFLPRGCPSSTARWIAACCCAPSDWRTPSWCSTRAAISRSADCRSMGLIDVVVGAGRAGRRACTGAGTVHPRTAVAAWRQGRAGGTGSRRGGAACRGDRRGAGGGGEQRGLPRGAPGVPREAHAGVQGTLTMDAQFQPLDPAKFRDPFITAKGEARAQVALRALETLWFNTGTLCNLTCRNCYIESSPRNDRLAYLTRDEVRDYLDEIARDGLPTRLIGFTGGEPFMNPDIIAHAGRRAVARLRRAGADQCDEADAQAAAAAAGTARRLWRSAAHPRLARPLRAGGARGGARPAKLGTDHRRPGLAGAQRVCHRRGRPAVLRRAGSGPARRLRAAVRRTRCADRCGRSGAADAVPGDGRAARRAGDHHRLLGHPAQVAGRRDVRLRAHGGEAQGRGDARRAGLHAAGLRSRSSNSAARWPRRRGRCRSTIRIARRSACWAARPAAADRYACPAAPDSSSGSMFSLPSARRHLVSWSPSNTMVSSAGTESHAFCWISASSWPGPQPA